MNAFALAQIVGDEDGRAVASTKIQAFNSKYPDIAIRADNLRSSLRARAQHSAQSENGIMLSKKIAARVKDEVGAMAQQ